MINNALLHDNPQNIGIDDWVVYKDKVGKVIGCVKSNICEFWVLWSGFNTPHSAIASSLIKVNIDQDYTGCKFNGGYCKRLQWYQGQIVAEVHLDDGTSNHWKLSYLQNRLANQSINVYTNSNLINLSLDQILVDKRLQARTRMSKPTVHDYTCKLKKGVKFPPIIVFMVDSHYYLVDGFHRVESAKRVNLDAISAIVHYGTFRDALLFSLSVNTDHGLSRSNADKRKVVMTLLNDSEWSKLSLRELSAIAQVSHSFIAKVKQEIRKPKKKDLSLPPDVVKKGKDCFSIHCDKSTIDLLRAFMKESDLATAEGAINRLLFSYKEMEKI
ncbi:MAG: hypothetical protein ACXITR_13450 [Cyanobacterium sp.]